MMRSNRKEKYTVAALSVVALVGCTDVANTIHDMRGDPRTVPQGAQVNFNGRHAPVLNPGSNGSGSNGSGSDGVMNTTPAPGVYVNAPVPSAQSASAADSGRRVPQENGSNVADNSAVQAAPVTAVDTAPQPASASAPVAANGEPVYPPLASVPAIPAHSTTDQSKAAFRALNKERGRDDAARQNLMDAQNVAVMTSPETGQLVNNPADVALPPVTQMPVALAQPIAPAPVPAPAPKVAAASPSGFDGWLHNMLGSKDDPQPLPGTPQAAASPSAGGAVAAPQDISANAPAGSAIVADASAVPAPVPEMVQSGSSSDMPEPPTLAETQAGKEVAPGVMLLPATGSPAAPLEASVATASPPAATPSEPASAPVYPAVADAAPQPLSQPQALPSPVYPAVADAAPQPLSQSQALPSPVYPAVADAAPQPMPQPLPTPMEAVASAPQALEPVHLHPTAAMAAEDQGLAPPSAPAAPAPLGAPAQTMPALVADTAPAPAPALVTEIAPAPLTAPVPMMQPTASYAIEQPITLVPPSSNATSSLPSQTRYLADSRYAARRARGTADDSSN